MSRTTWLHWCRAPLWASQTFLVGNVWVVPGLAFGLLDGQEWCLTKGSWSTELDKVSLKDSDQQFCVFMQGSILGTYPKGVLPPWGWDQKRLCSPMQRRDSRDFRIANLVLKEYLLSIFYLTLAMMISQFMSFRIISTIQKHLINAHWLLDNNTHTCLILTTSQTLC